MHSDGDENIRAAKNAEIMEIAWGNANHGKGLAANADSLADDVGITAEFAFPQAVAEHSHRICSRRSVLFGTKPSTQLGLHAHNLEKVAIDERAKHRYFLAGDNQVCP